MNILAFLPKFTVSHSNSKLLPAVYWHAGEFSRRVFHPGAVGQVRPEQIAPAGPIHVKLTAVGPVTNSGALRVRTPHGEVELAGDMILEQGAVQTLEITSPGMVGSEMLNGNFMWDIKKIAVFRTDWAFDINQKKGNLMGVLDVKCFDNDHASFHVVFTKDLAGSSYNANNVQFIYSNSFEQLLGLKKKSPTELLVKNNKLDNPIESPDSVDSGNSVGSSDFIESGDSTELPESTESGDSIGSSDSAPLTEADSIGSHLVTVAICHGKNATNLIVFGAIQMWDNELFKMSLLFSFIKIVIMLKKLAGNKKGKHP